MILVFIALLSACSLVASQTTLGCIWNLDLQTVTITDLDGVRYNTFVNKRGLPHYFDPRTGNTKCSWYKGRTWFCGPCGNVIFKEIQMLSNDDTTCYVNLNTPGNQHYLEAVIVSDTYFVTEPLIMNAVACSNNLTEQYDPWVFNPEEISTTLPTVQYTGPSNPINTAAVANMAVDAGAVTSITSTISKDRTPGITTIPTTTTLSTATSKGQSNGVASGHKDTVAIPAPGPDVPSGSHTAELIKAGTSQSTNADVNDLAVLYHTESSAADDSINQQPPGCEKCEAQNQVSFMSGKHMYNTCIDEEQLGQDLVLHGDTINLLCSMKQKEHEGGLCSSCYQVMDGFKGGRYVCAVTVRAEDGSWEHKWTIQPGQEYAPFPMKAMPVKINCSLPQ